MERVLFDHMRKYIAIEKWIGYGYEKQVTGVNMDNIIHTTSAVRRLGFPVYTSNIDEYSDALNGKVTLEYSEGNGLDHRNHNDWFSEHGLDLGSPHEDMVKAHPFVAPAELVVVFSKESDEDIIGLMLVTGNEMLSIVVSLSFLEAIR